MVSPHRRPLAVCRLSGSGLALAAATGVSLRTIALYCFQPVLDGPDTARLGRVGE